MKTFCLDTAQNHVNNLFLCQCSSVQHQMMASAQVVETSVNTNNSLSQDYTTNPDDHSNHNIDSLGSNVSLLYPR